MNDVQRQDLPGLLVNESFASGLVGWDATFGVAHVASFADTAGAAGAAYAPRYAAELPARAALSQTSERSDLATYPSERAVGPLKSRVVGAATVRMQPLPGATSDGLPLLDLRDALRFVDADGEIDAFGAQAVVGDLHRAAYSGPFRLGEYAESFVEASPLQRGLPVLTTSAAFVGGVYAYDGRRDVNPTSVATVVLTAAEAAARFARDPDVAQSGARPLQTTALGSALVESGGTPYRSSLEVRSTAGFRAGDRVRVYAVTDPDLWADFTVYRPLDSRTLQFVEPVPAAMVGLPPPDAPVVRLSDGAPALDALLVGFQPGDSMVFSYPRFAVGEVVGPARVGNGAIEVDVRPVPRSPFLPATNDFATETEGVSTADVSAAPFVGGASPAWLSYVVVADAAPFADAVGDYPAGRRVRIVGPAGDERLFTLHSVDVATNQLRFAGVGDYVPAGGSLSVFPPGSVVTLLTGSEAEADTAPLGGWFLSPTTRVGLSFALPVFRHEFTLAVSWRSVSGTFDGVPELRYVGRNGRETLRVPLLPVRPGVYYEDASLSADAGTAFRRRVWRFRLETRAPQAGFLRLTLRAGTQPVLLGDVSLLRGDFTSRGDFSDLDDPAVSAVADRRSALDRLRAAADADGVPRGTVVLYAGGARCPAGWKAVDSVAGSSVDGLETLPPVTAAVYDAARDRTELRWEGRSFDLLGADGRPLAVPGAATAVSALLPDGATFGAPDAVSDVYETLTVGPVRQRAVPGMGVRVRATSFADPYARNFDYVATIRDVVAERVEIDGPAPGGPPYDGVSYPYFMWSGAFRPGEVNFTPLGPPSAAGSGVGQPASYAGLNSAFGTVTYDYLGASVTARGYVGAPGSASSTTEKRALFSGFRAGDPTLTLTNVSLPSLSAGMRVYVRWRRLIGGPHLPANIGLTVGAAELGFVAEVVSYAPPYGAVAGTLTVRRADGHAMVTDQAGPIGGVAAVSDVRLFPSSVALTRTPIDVGTASGYVWSARRYVSTTSVFVAGDVAADVVAFNAEGLVLEPSGLLRYGDAGFGYGDGEHVHVVTRGDAPFNENLAPHVSTPNANGTPAVRVARRHGHGPLGSPAFVVPPYRAFLLCEKA